VGEEPDAAYDAATGVDAVAAESWHRCCFPFPGSMTRTTNGFLECSCPAGVICNYEIQICSSDTGPPMALTDTGFADAGPVDAALDALVTHDTGATP
jgi:hypothetical protein